MNIFKKAREAEEAVKATPEYKDWEEARKDYIGAKEKKQEAAKVHDEAVEAEGDAWEALKEAWTCETLVEAIKAMEKAEEAYMKSGYRYLV